jgi:hypothetical protein
VLEWFKNSGYKIEYYYSVISDASKNGHVKILEWFKNYGLFIMHLVIDIFRF